MALHDTPLGQPDGSGAGVGLGVGAGVGLAVGAIVADGGANVRGSEAAGVAAARPHALTRATRARPSEARRNTNSG